MTRILSRRNIEELLTVEDSIRVLRDGFREGAWGDGHRYRTSLPFPGTATALMPGTLESIPAFTIKSNVKFPDAKPALRGVVSVHASADGELLGILDSATITALRTGLSAAIATDILARPDARVVSVVGAGAQAEIMVRGLKHLRGSFDLIVHDDVRERAETFARKHGGEVVSGPDDAASAADIVLLATWGWTPVLTEVPRRKGWHVTTVGSDEPGKHEVSSALVRGTLLFVDDHALSSEMGVLSFVDRVADATLADVLAGRHPGRTTSDETTVYAPVGLPWQDLALSWLALQLAERRNIGLEVDLLD